MKQNSFLEKVHTALLTLCLTVICFCAHTLWEMNMKLARNDEVNLRQDASITNLTILVASGQGDQNKISNRLIYLEAMLPDKQKKIQR